MKKTQIPLITAVLLLLALPAAAPAGTFTLHSCQTPSGTFVGDEGWVARSAIPSPGYAHGEIERCDPLKRSLDLTIDAGDRVAAGHWLKATLTAASNTSITDVSLVRSYHLGWPFLDGAEDRPYAYHAWHGDGESTRIIELRTPVEREETLSQPTPTAYGRAADHWPSVTISLKCWGFYGANDCGAFPASLSLSRATFTVNDAHAPAGTADVGGLRGDVRGSAAIRVSASDVGGGVYRAIVSVDGSVVARQVLDENGGACGDVEPGNGDAYEFAAPRPCPLSAAGDVTFDTRGLLDGQHQVRVEVEDVAGNARVLHEGTFTSRNGPVATVAPSISGGDGPRVGDVLIGINGSWDGALGQPTLRWLRCDAAGQGCGPVSGAIGGIYAVTPIDVGGRLVLEELASNGNGDGSTRSQPTAVVVAAPKPDGDPAPKPPGGGETPAPGAPTPPGGGTGGVDGLHNPVADQGGRAPNGDGASSAARLTLRVRLAGGGSATRARGRHSRRWTVTGRLVDPAGRPIAGARVNLVARVGAGRWKAGGVVRTGADGRFSRTLAAGPSRQLRATYFAFADSRSFRGSNVVAIESLAPLTIRADRSRVAGGGRVALAGRAGGARIPRGGLLVALQGHQAGFGWRTFRTVRTNAAGSWKAGYRFRSRAGRFAFRALVPRQSGYPFAASTSAAVTVRVG